MATAARLDAKHRSTQAAISQEALLEAELEERISDFVDDPLGFVEFVFDWGEGEIKNESGPDAWQAELLRLVGEKCLTVEEALRIAVGSGHGIGKTTFVSWVILWCISTRPNLAGVVTANTRSQLTSKTWRELSLWHKRAINSHWFEWTATKFCHKSAPETWAVNAVAWSKNKPEAFAGLHAEHVLVIMDEASAIDDAIWETTEGAMTTPGAMWFVFGNLTRNTGKFRECFGRFRHRWITRSIDSRNAKKANRKQIDQWIEDYGEDSDFVRIRVKGEPPIAGSTQFIPSDVVDAAMAREEDPADVYGPRVIGIDAARFGDDKSIILMRDGDVVLPEWIKKFQGLDAVQLAGHAGEMINAYQPDGVFVEGDGPGSGVIDILKANGFRVQEVHTSSEPLDKDQYANLRAEMWGRTRDWLKRGKARLPFDQELKDDLTGVEYGYNLKGRIQLERKEEMKSRGLASPDCGDALALTFARIVASKAAKAAMGLTGPRQTKAKVGHASFKAMYRRNKR